MKLKNFVLIGILILEVILFSCQKREETISISVENITENPEVKLISVYDNYQVDLRLKTAWGFATIIKIHQELILFDSKNLD